MSLANKIETTANVATIGVAVLLSAVLVKGYLLPMAASRNPAVVTESAIGTNLKNRLSGVDWGQNGRTLVLAISTQCHFCTESAPFFRRLGEAAGKKVKMVAVLPQSVAESEQYLSGAGVHVDQVRQVSLGNIGVRGTPTMLLVNSKGVVTDVWTGKVEPQRQDQVLSAILGAHS